MSKKMNVIFTVCCVLGLGVVWAQNGVPEKEYNCQLPPNCPMKTQRYLEYLGYLDPMKNCTQNDIRAALVKFQEFNINFMNITVTGACDEATKAVMDMPRCGCEDIVKADQKKKMMPPSNALIGPQAFTLGSTRWRKRELTWSVLKYPQTPQNRLLSQSQVDDAMKRGLEIWSKVTQMTFRHSPNDLNADIKIKFEVRSHDFAGAPPSYGFDGPGGTLAHAFFPESGDVHFDDDERFVLNSNEGTELYIVAAHEFGHTLGISHSNIKEALMAPYYRYSTNLELHPDDVAAVQTLYGPRTQPQPDTMRPVTPTPPPTTRNPPPDYCNIQIKGAFSIGETTFIFSRERTDDSRLETFVYKVRSTGIVENSRTSIEDLFIKTSSSRYPRAHPYTVDAAAYIPDRNKVFLFSGTRAYRYSVENRNGPFRLDTDDGYPRWMDVTEFPERPRAAVALPYSNYDAYYMLIFGTTMVWDWNFYTQRVGAWAYPINVYGRNMPERVDGAFLENGRENAIFFKNDKYYKFNLRYRRVLENSVFDIKKDFLKKGCA